MWAGTQLLYGQDWEAVNITLQQWFQCNSLAILKQANLEGVGSLETLSGEAQLKKTPCSSDNTNMIIFFLIRVSVKWGAYLTPFPPVQISDTDNAWTTILRHLEASRGRGLQMQSHLWLENSIASNHLRWGILLARLGTKNSTLPKARELDNFALSFVDKL